MSIGKSKGITKENIVNVTLDLIKDRDNIRSVNLREIARVLGCAHTNIYNYFRDMDEIFWASLDEVLEKSIIFINNKLDGKDCPDKKLQNFYNGFIEFYIENRGWFILFWMEKLHGATPERSLNKITNTVSQYNSILNNIFTKLYQVQLNEQQVMNIFHTVHCYLHGEISIFLCGRGLITEETAFKERTLNECIRLNTLLIQNIKAGGETHQLL